MRCLLRKVISPAAAGLLISILCISDIPDARAATETRPSLFSAIPTNAGGFVVVSDMQRLGAAAARATHPAGLLPQALVNIAKTLSEGYGLTASAWNPHGRVAVIALSPRLFISFPYLYQAVTLIPAPQLRPLFSGDQLSHSGHGIWQIKTPHATIYAAKHGGFVVLAYQQAAIRRYLNVHTWGLPRLPAAEEAALRNGAELCWFINTQGFRKPLAAEVKSILADKRQYPDLALLELAEAAQQIANAALVVKLHRSDAVVTIFLNAENHCPLAALIGGIPPLGPHPLEGLPMEPYMALAAWASNPKAEAAWIKASLPPLDLHHRISAHPNLQRQLTAMRKLGGPATERLMLPTPVAGTTPVISAISVATSPGLASGFHAQIGRWAEMASAINPLLSRLNLKWEIYTQQNAIRVAGKYFTRTHMDIVTGNSPMPQRNIMVPLVMLERKFIFGEHGLSIDAAMAGNRMITGANVSHKMLSDTLQSVHDHADPLDSTPAIVDCAKYALTGSFVRGYLRLSRLLPALGLDNWHSYPTPAPVAFAGRAKGLSMEMRIWVPIQRENAFFQAALASPALLLGRIALW